MTDELRSRVLALSARDREELAYALLESLYADTAPDPVRLVGTDRSALGLLQDGLLRDGPLRDGSPLDGVDAMTRDRANVVDLNEARARLMPS